MNDILETLRLNTNKKIVLAVTFSLRSGKQCYEGEKLNATYYDELYTTFTEAGYRIHKPKEKVYRRKITSNGLGKRKRETYGQTMVFYCFTLEKMSEKPVFTVVVNKSGEKVSEFLGKTLDKI